MKNKLTVISISAITLFIYIFDHNLIPIYAITSETKANQYWEAFCEYIPELHNNITKPELWPEWDRTGQQLLYGGRPYEELSTSEKITAKGLYYTIKADQATSKIRQDSLINQFINQGNAYENWHKQMDRIEGISEELSTGKGSGSLVPKSGSYYKVDPETGLYEYQAPTSGAGQAALGLAGLGLVGVSKAVGILQKDDFDGEIWAQMRDDLGEEALKNLNDGDYQAALQKYMQSRGYNALFLIDEAADDGDPICILAEDYLFNMLDAVTGENESIAGYYEDNPPPEYEWDGESNIGKPLYFDYTVTFQRIENGKYIDCITRRFRNTDFPDNVIKVRTCFGINKIEVNGHTLNCYNYIVNYNTSSYEFNPNFRHYYYDKKGNNIRVDNVIINSSTSERDGCSTSCYNTVQKFSANVPIFDDLNDAVNYAKTGVVNNAINDPSLKEDPRYDLSPVAVSDGACPALQPYTPYKASDLQEYMDDVNEKHDAVVDAPGYQPSTDPVTLPEPVIEPEPQPYRTIIIEPSPVNPDPGDDPTVNPDPQPDPDPSPTPSGNGFFPDIPSVDGDLDDLTANAGMLKEVFPFCIPHDFKLLMETFDVLDEEPNIQTNSVQGRALLKANRSEPYRPVFHVPLEFDVFGKTVSYEFDIDITKDLDDFIAYFKWFQILVFCFGMMKLTFKVSHVF